MTPIIHHQVHIIITEMVLIPTVIQDRIIPIKAMSLIQVTGHITAKVLVLLSTHKKDHLVVLSIHKALDILFTVKALIIPDTHKNHRRTFSIIIIIPRSITINTTKANM